MADSASGSISVHSVAKVEFRKVVNELRGQNFDTIRFSTYRTSCKLRFLQKRFHLHLVDIWSIIESFRENGLNIVDYNSELKVSRIELLLSSVYHNLNKRLPAPQQIDTDQAINTLLAFLIAVYDRADTGKVRIFSVKVALATMCAGKLLDKLRYIFSQISDAASGIMDNLRFHDYLQEVLALPTAVFEGPTFGYSESNAKTCLSSRSKVTINVFLELLMDESTPPCLMWLPLLHRMANVEHVFHPVVCDGCSRDSFTGFRYKCQRCNNYQLCQDCFWRGRVSGSHTNQHEMKEYSSYKSPTKQLGRAIGKTFRCLPMQQSSAPSTLREYDYPEKQLDLVNIIPHMTPPLQNGLQNQYDSHSSDDQLSLSNPLNYPNFSESQTGLDDEHRLIARYSAKLASRSMLSQASPLGGGMDAVAQRAAAASLERRNKEMLREIQRLQAMQKESASSMLNINGGGSGLVSELHVLRQRKDQLEQRMMNLQDGRRGLMMQLDNLMRMLKNQQAPRPDTAMSSPVSLSGVRGDIACAFRDSTPIASLSSRAVMTDSSDKFGGSNLQNDLLVAANSITNTMSEFTISMNDAGDPVTDNEE